MDWFDEQKPVFSDVCPDSKICVCWDMALRTNHVFLSPCNRSRCYSCGPKKRWELVQRIATAKPTKFATLTVWPLHLRAHYERTHKPIDKTAENRPIPQLKRTTRSKRKTQPKTAEPNYESPREAYDRTRKAISELFRYYAKTGRKSEYVKLLEETEIGYPHWHLLIRGPYLPQQEMSGIWSQLTGSFRVDIRPINDGHAAKYVTKYVTKTDSVEFTKRKVSASRQFFPKKDKPPSNPMLQDFEVLQYDDAPAWLERNLTTAGWVERSPQHWILADRQPGDEPPRKLLDWLDMQT